MKRLTRIERAIKRAEELDKVFDPGEPREAFINQTTSNDKAKVEVEIDIQKESYAVREALSIRQMNQSIVNQENFWVYTNPENLVAKIVQVEDHEKKFDSSNSPPPSINDDGETQWRKDKK